MFSTICCLNPDCTKPENPEGTKYCSTCGTAIVILRHHYRPIQLLSDEGGFGRTYLAEDLDKLREICVIKQLAPQQQGTAALNKAQQLFEQEARQLQQLGKHPQIPQLLAYFAENGYLYLVQEYIEGKTLNKLPKPWNEENIKDFLNDILPILEFVHQNQVIHRDIKPTNIMRRDADGRYILIDFGASREFQRTVATKGTIIGTFGYSAFEQLKEGEAHQASDLYSLGVTCFYLLTEVDPHELYIDEGYGWLKTWTEHLKQPISEQFQEFLGKLLQKERKNRYQSAVEVIDALREGTRNVPLQSPEMGTRNVPLPSPSMSASPPLQTFSFETAQISIVEGYFNKQEIITRETKQAQQFILDIGSRVTLEMVKVPGGRFLMGSPESEKNRSSDERQYQITVDDFFIGKYEITQEQWQAIMGNNPSYFKKGGKYPLESVSWNKCQEFFEKLSQKTGLDFRLPTEAEWEYACRAGTTTPFYFGETLSTDLANYNGNYIYGSSTKGIYQQETTKVGSFPANAFGLYDMHGNVWEWCQDDYDNHSRYKCLRGGSWDSYPWFCRSANRFRINPDFRHYYLGFRVVCRDAGLFTL